MKVYELRYPGEPVVFFVGLGEDLESWRKEAVPGSHLSHVVNYFKRTAKKPEQNIVLDTPDTLAAKSLYDALVLQYRKFYGRRFTVKSKRGV